MQGSFGKGRNGEKQRVGQKLRADLIVEGLREKKSRALKL
jgi:hypothetical protein